MHRGSYECGSAILHSEVQSEANMKDLRARVVLAFPRTRENLTPVSTNKQQHESSDATI
jgi:hypothetical protein